MKQDELKKVLELHKKWLNHEPDGVRADLSSADLWKTDLRGANLYKTDLRGANLCEADLRGANLYETDLRGADLREANLCGADLRGADLCEANLCAANLYGANLQGADLREANLREADLCEADMRGADLDKIDLYRANLYGVNLWAAKNIPFIPYACPEKGEFVAFKKCGEYIIELLIPADAKRCSSTTRKCRASYAKVLSITSLFGNPVNKDSVTNTNYSPSVVYKVGEFVYPDSFDDNRWKECSHGIHFFINRQEAVEY